MTTKRTRIATSLSCFLWLAAIAACEDTGRTSLGGRIACGELFCEGGQLCTWMAAGVDAAVPGKPSYYCSTVPDGCYVTDCVGTGCPACIRDLCFPGHTGWGIELTNRTLACSAQ